MKAMDFGLVAVFLMITLTVIYASIVIYSNPLEEVIEYVGRDDAGSSVEWRD